MQDNEEGTREETRRKVQGTGIRNALRLNGEILESRNLNFEPYYYIASHETGF